VGVGRKIDKKSNLSLKKEKNKQKEQKVANNSSASKEYFSDLVCDECVFPGLFL
jgi:hypothetical protein